MLSDWRKSNVFWKIPRLRPFILLARVTCRWRWIRVTGGILLTGENRSTQRKPCLLPLWAPQIPHGLIWDRTRASALKGRLLTVRTVAGAIYYNSYLYEVMQSSPQPISNCRYQKSPVILTFLLSIGRLMYIYIIQKIISYLMEDTVH
jgi:hypothetical protein